MSQPGERTVIVEEPPPARTSGTPARVLLDRTLRVVAAGPRPFFQAALVSLAVTCGLAIMIALEIRPAGPLPRPQQDAIITSLAALAAIGVLTLATVLVPARLRASLLDRIVAPSQRAAIWLALTLWFPLVDVIAYYRGESTLPPTQVWISFGYQDKRWVTAAYLIGALAPMLLLVFASRVLQAGRARPATWRSWLRDLAPCGRAAGTVSAPVPAGIVPAQAVAADSVATAADTSGTAVAPAGEGRGAPGKVALAAAVRRFPDANAMRVAVGVLTALALAFYFYGPPWYLNRTSGSLSLGYQEDLYLGGLQAISKGAVPYIGPAAIQYGPGSQWFSYEFMRHFATFSVVGFRESWAMFEWAGASILFVVFFLALGYFRGLIGALMSALIYPALQLMEFAPHGSYTGFFGWASPLRYAGAISLLLLLPAAIRRAPARSGLAGAFVLGLIWGVLSYIAQENLAAGAVGAVVLSALLLFSGAASRRSVVTSLLAVLGGFVVSWLPVVVFYAGKGLLGRFFYLYFMITRAVAEGYSNTPYGWPRSNLPPVPAQIATSAPWAHMYYILPFVLAALALLAVLKLRPFQVALDWSKDRVLLVSLLLTTILLYQGALLRSDADHLTGTLLTVPFLVVAVATMLPRQLGIRRWPVLGLAGVVLFAASFFLLPFHSYKFATIGAQAEAPTLDRQQLAAEKDPPIPPELAAHRVGAGVWDRPACCQRFSEPMSDFIILADRLHAIIGTRRTYVEDFQAGYPGIIYFVANLKPAPIPLDQHTMVFTEQQDAAYLSDFREHVLPKTKALVTDILGTPEDLAFEQYYPNYRLIELHYRRSHALWVLLS
ncbi:MAG TPA: hypothetical protein VMB74_01520 [Streptosporangiaceae bacterium]|nr:hypothetical protein [Streptosporangiaceae bacterium]